jgi:ribosomal protein L12E/L44/L45/RPP1/RPP2
MAKISVTYHAPKGDAKVCDMYGHSFEDGKAVQVDDDTPAQKAIVLKLRGNKVFEVSGEGGTAYVKPTAAEAKAMADEAKAEAKEAKEDKEDKE